MDASRPSQYHTKIIQEGRAKIVVYESGPVPTKQMPVFYNARMVINRNFSTLALQAWQEEIQRPVLACDVMAGSGVRAVRLALEVEGVGCIYANDLSPAAYRQMVQNLGLNGVESDRVKLSTKEANAFFLERREDKFDYIDIDPFGAPVPYLFNALHAIKPRGGLLGITATDTAVLHGAHAKACPLKYGAQPLHVSFMKEFGARILVQWIQATAASQGFCIDVKAVLSQAHFVKVFVVMKGSRTGATQNLQEIGWVQFCQECWEIVTTRGKFPDGLPSQCPKCGGKLITGGPAWLGSMYDEEFLQRMDAAQEKIDEFPQKGETRKLLTLMRQDLEGPLFGIHIPKLCDKLDISGPAFPAIQAELASLGYAYFRTHFDPEIIKTDAPVAVMEEILRRLSA
jgi:tRNA (guanine26-N2/guanine27-N2)-dimethyltransferase